MAVSVGGIGKSPGLRGTNLAGPASGTNHRPDGVRTCTKGRFAARNQTGERPPTAQLASDAASRTLCSVPSTATPDARFSSFALRASPVMRRSRFDQS